MLSRLAAGAMGSAAAIHVASTVSHGTASALLQNGFARSHLYGQGNRAKCLCFNPMHLNEDRKYEVLYAMRGFDVIGFPGTSKQHNADMTASADQKCIHVKVRKYDVYHFGFPRFVTECK